MSSNSTARARKSKLQDGKSPARFHKSVINTGGLADICRRHLLKERDLYVLVSLQAEYQRLGKPALEFRSRYQMAKLLGWPDTAASYESVMGAIERLHEIDGEIDKFRGVLVYTANGRTWPRRQHVKKRFDWILGVCGGGRDGSGNFVQLEFSRSWREANDGKYGYYVLINPDEIRQLRGLSTRLLLMLVSCYDFSPLHISLENLSRKICLSYRNPAEFERQIRPMLAKIEHVLGVEFDVEVERKKNGVPTITVSQAKQRKRSDDFNAFDGPVDEYGYSTFWDTTKRHAH